ncbi:hypothetical protein [Mesorhizobium waimense]|nr:hypothetical protein [Mesorhizobium waimense]
MSEQRGGFVGIGIHGYLALQGLTLKTSEQDSGRVVDIDHDAL